MSGGVIWMNFIVLGSWPREYQSSPMSDQTDAIQMFCCASNCSTATLPLGWKPLLYIAGCSSLRSFHPGAQAVSSLPS